MTAAEQVLDDSRVDLAVSAVSHGLGRSPIELRLLENGRAIDVRRATPAGEGTPVREVFQVSPGPGRRPSTPSRRRRVAGELVPENNARSVLVQPPSRPRRVLLVEGAPGFEHSFLKRAWAADRGLEIDSVVRKGKDEQGGDTFYIQAARTRADSLTSGFPPTREALFLYDALVLANVEGHQFTAAQLEATRAFVGARGGGLLVLGARSFPAPGAGRHRAGGGAAARADAERRRHRRSWGRRSASNARRQPRRADGGGESPPGHAARAGARRDAEAMGSAARRWLRRRRSEGRVLAPACSRSRAGRAARRGHSWPSSASAKDARWCSRARPRGGGG